MTAYTAPVPEMRFVLREIVGLDEIARTARALRR